MRRIVICLLLFVSCAVMAQDLKVYSAIGNPTLITQDGQFVLKKTDIVTPMSVINIPYNSSLELFDETNKKQYIINNPGRGIVRNLLNDKRNSIINLTDRYFRYVVSQMCSKNVNRTVSDAATITRDSLSVEMNQENKKK